jgi:lipoprotein-anchoring transpeptidase ErfK/SrfK
MAFIVQSASRDAYRTGQAMVHLRAFGFSGNRKLQFRATNVLVLAGALLLAPAVLAGSASAQGLSYASVPQSSFPADNIIMSNEPAVTDDSDGSSSVLPERLRRTEIAFNTREAPGTVIIDTGNTALYYVLGQGRAIRYGVGVGREGFTWTGSQRVSRMKEWPDWFPPKEMIGRQPYLPRFMAGGDTNPLGARALYLGNTEYRIHGTNQPSTIGTFVSSGCIRLTNDDISDLYTRVNVGTRVVVLPGASSPVSSATPATVTQ